MSYKKQFLETNIYLVFFLLAVILLGFFFRFTNLSHKVFWVDEVSTAVRVSGYTVSEVTNSLASQDIVGRDTLRAFQTINPSRTLKDSLDALIQSPEHAPFYFLLTRFWMQLWGNSIIVMRSLSAIFSLCALPSLCWFSYELFERSRFSKRISWLAVGIMSTSPFHVAYAQEARPYSLWTVTILLMGASFLRAKRLNSRSAWCLYSFCSIIGFYTSLFSLYIAAFQCLYLLIETTKKNLSVIINCILAIGFALLAFSPWILVIVNHLDLLHDNTSWTRGNFNLADIIAVYIGTNLLTFGDLPLSTNSNPIQIAIVLLVLVVISLTGIKFYPRWQNKILKLVCLGLLSCLLFILTKYIYLDWITIIGAFVAIVILSLSAYSLYYLVTQTNKQRWLYIICLMLSLPLPLLIGDIINQGQSSTAPRYLIPLQLGILVAVAFTVANRLNSNRRKLWQGLIAVFIIIGIYSNIRNLNTSPFYQKGRNTNNPAIAKIINQHPQSLVLIEASEAMDIVSLAYSLMPEVKYKVISSEIKINLHFGKFDRVFILKPSQKLKQYLSLNPEIKFKQVYKSHIFSEDEFPLDLWQIERR